MAMRDKEYQPKPVKSVLSLTALGLLVCSLLLLSSHSYADCIAGLPCVVGKTENLPDDDTDGPNAPGAPNANKTDSAACDGDFMNQIYGKAFLEAERENVMNEVLVRKTDSVLEYTCFDQLLGVAAEAVPPIFSGMHWEMNVSNPGEICTTTPNSIGACSPGGPIHIIVDMLPTRFPNSLNTLIMGALNGYIDNQFGSDYMGDYADGLNYNPPNQVNVGAAYTCDEMDLIHFFAKCDNFATDDEFFSFEQLVDFDPRVFPAECDGTQIKQGRINLANNKNHNYVNYDDVITYFDRILAASGGYECGPPIPTGILAFRNRYNVTDDIGNVEKLDSSEVYVEQVCLNPGCYFEPPGTCKKD